MKAQKGATQHISGASMIQPELMSMFVMLYARLLGFQTLPRGFKRSDSLARVALSADPKCQLCLESSWSSGDPFGASHVFQALR